MRCAAALAAIAFLAAACSSRRALPCNALPGRAVPILRDKSHIPSVDSKHVPYDSIPPTSGPHVPFVVAPGVYRSPIADEIQLHDLEHGHVLVQYARSLPKDEVKALESIARRYPRDVVVAPYPKLRSGVALTAWGRIERLPSDDTTKIRTFVKALAGRYVHGWRGGARVCTHYTALATLPRRGRSLLAAQPQRRTRRPA